MPFFNFYRENLTMPKPSQRTRNPQRIILPRHSLKLTYQRELILTIFLKLEHVTAEQLYHILGKKRPLTSDWRPFIAHSKSIL